MGEVDYADAAYHRESTGNATSLPPPPISGSRPPVPVALPKRRLVCKLLNRLEMWKLDSLRRDLSPNI